MQTVYLGAAIFVALLLVSPLWRIVRGPTIFDRLLGASVLGTKTIVLLMLMGEAGDRLDMFVDISLGYGLALLAGTLVTSKFLEQHVGTAPEPQQAIDGFTTAGKGRKGRGRKGRSK